MSASRIEALIFFLVTLILFTIGLKTQEITGFDSRFYLFAQGMIRHGLTWFPLTYDQPYPDYPASSTAIIYLFSLIFGGLNKLVAVLPTAIAASITVALTYKLGSLHNRHWGFCAALLMILTHAFFKSARGISLDMYPAMITILCFYLVYSADHFNPSRRRFWIYPLFLLGLIFRGPIGLVIPTGVICSYYLLQGRLKKFFLTGFIAAILLCICTSVLLFLAFHTGGQGFMREVLRMEVIGRIDNYFLPRYFYFTSSFADYALSYPLALLVLAGVIFYKFRQENLPHQKFILYLSGWMMIILLGMSIPDDKKVRYILAIVPAIALLAAYPFSALFSQGYFNFLRLSIRWLLLFFPLIIISVILLIRHSLPIDIHPELILSIFAGIQIINLIASYYFHDLLLREKIIFSLAALSFVIANLIIVEPVQLYVDRARDFVLAIEKSRHQENARLIFYRELPDGLPIKYLVNKKTFDQPIFMADEKALINYSAPAYFVTSAAYFAGLSANIAERLHVIGSDRLGHVPVVVFIRKERVMSKNQICIHSFVSGKVQGVWFRASTQTEAKRLGLTGWARNLPDGRVEVLACGTREKLTELFAWLKHGPDLAYVQELSYEELPWQELSGFETW